MVKVYFISGLSANCKVFDNIMLPPTFSKVYLEWHLPQNDDTLESYVRLMVNRIDTSKPFILIGYSFGAIIAQEMNKIVKPEKTIIIASMKHVDEIPLMFKWGRTVKFADRFPLWSLMGYPKLRDSMIRLVYRIHSAKNAQYIGYTDPQYMQWSVKQILNWNPSQECCNLFHIHGTRDKIFPVKNIKDAIIVDGGDHLMVMKMHQKISLILQTILTD